MSKSDGYRAARAEDVGAITAVHMAAFPEFFLAQLGRRFLARYYELVLEYEGGILLLHEEEGEVSGFVAGFCRPAGFYAAMRARKARMALAMIPAMLRHPSLIKRVMDRFRRTGDEDSVGPDESSELASIAVLPEMAGKGIGQALTRGFIEASGDRGAEYVYLTTDRNDNERVNRFYQRMGFDAHRTFTAHEAREMVEYRYEDGDSVNSES